MTDSVTEPQGLSAKNLEFIKQTILDVLREAKSIKIFVFGSRATGLYKQYSDLDLWLEGQPPVRPEHLAELNSIFEDSELPISIDLVTPEVCLAEYKPQIERQKVLWFEKHF